MLRQIPEVEGNEKLVATNFVSRHKTLMSRQEQDKLHPNSIVTLSKSVTTESK